MKLDTFSVFRLVTELHADAEYRDGMPPDQGSTLGSTPWIHTHGYIMPPLRGFPLAVGWRINAWAR